MREAVVFGEVTRHRASVTERVFEALRGVLGDVLIQRTRHGARGEDALDGGVIARTERRDVTARAIDLLGGIALSQQQDLARLRAPDPRSPWLIKRKNSAACLLMLSNATWI